MEHDDLTPKREPIFNIPLVVMIFLVLLVLIHGAREFLLPLAYQLDVLLRFGFVPARYMVDGAQLPLFGPSRYFTPVSYAFLHGSWEHLLMNAIWLLAFGSAIARRFGTLRFIIFSLLAATAGALLHFLSGPNSIAPMVGASAIISAFMGAAVRFAFVPGQFRSGQDPLHFPALSIVDTFKHPSSFTFIAIWFIANYLFGSDVLSVVGNGAKIAWQAHIGGFLFGLLAFSSFDPKRN